MAKKFGRRRHYRHHARHPLQIKVKKQTALTVGAIWLWLFAAVITFAFFSESPVMTALREQLTNHVGWVMYGLPPFLVLLSFLFFKIKHDIGEPNIPPVGFLPVPVG